ncbi:hypothetical protein DNTS_003475, partial [Danionella cerebrum]
MRVSEAERERETERERRRSPGLQLPVLFDWIAMNTYCNNHEYCCGSYMDCRKRLMEVANCNNPRMQQRVGPMHGTLNHSQRQLMKQPLFHHHFHHHLHQQQPALLLQPSYLSEPSPTNFHQAPLESSSVPYYSSCTLPASSKSRGKFTNLRDSVKKSPTKSTAKVRASSSALWLSNSWAGFTLEKQADVIPPSAPIIPVIPISPVPAESPAIPEPTSQASPAPVVVNTESLDSSPYVSLN